MVKSSRSSYNPNFLRGFFALVALFTIGVLIYFTVIKEKFQSTPPIIYFYYMNGCGWCEKMKPEWAKCEQKAKTKGFITKKVSADEAGDKLEQLNINGFPAFVIEKNGKEVVYPSNNPRTADGLIEFMENL